MDEIVNHLEMTFALDPTTFVHNQTVCMGMNKKKEWIEKLSSYHTNEKYISESVFDLTASEEESVLDIMKEMPYKIFCNGPFILSKPS